MDQVGVKELKAHTSEILRRVEAGNEVEISRRGKVIARIVPTVQTSEEERTKRWEALLQLAEKVGQHAPAEVSAVDMINDVRREL
ncbi:MAG TPA: type II toxin-antitoxin system prevent-host-death family antitoxin [Thermomicrobiales bacterium]|nr:type II toxin-antitoxin system prevent-host-death family antitoxin [Thermomicrobiales bacterium]